MFSEQRKAAPYPFAAKLDQTRPIPAETPWIVAFGRVAFYARPVRASVLAHYRENTAPRVSDRRRRFARWMLLRNAFPWRLSYILRGDPTKHFARLSDMEQARILADIVSRSEGLIDG